MLGKNLINSILTQIPVFIIGFISGILSTRILGEEGKGVFTLFQANYQLFLLVFSFGIQTGIVYFISGKKIAEEIIAGLSIFIFLFSSTLLLLLLLIVHAVGADEYILTSGYTSYNYLVILFLLYFVTFFNNIIASFFQAHSKFKTINFISISNSIINAFLFLILYLILRYYTIETSEKINLVLYITLFSLVINSSLWFYFQKREINIKPSFNFKLSAYLKTFFSYNILIYIGMFVNFFNYRLDLWIVNHYLSKNDLSYYSLAANINQIILYIAVTIGSVMLPNLSGKENTKRIETFIRISRISFSFFTLLTLFAFVVSPFIIPLMYGIGFKNTVSPFQILLPGILFSCITQLFSIYIVSINKNIFNIIACSVGLIFTLYFDILLIPIWGINGAAIATCLSYFAIFLITYIFVYKQINKASFNLFIPLKSDIFFIKNLILKKT
jgi:O-antigen/teichoic acid export membrane protein